MIDALTLLAVVAIGAGLGWWLQGRGARGRKRVLTGAAIAFGMPVVLFVVANALSSDTLAWVAGLSLMAMAALAVPLGLGALVGHRLAARSRGSGRNAPTSAQAASSRPFNHTADVTRNPSRDVPVLQRSSAARAQQRGLLLAMAGVAAGFWVVLALGFRLHDQPAPMGLDKGLLPAAAVLIATVFIGLRSVWRRHGSRVAPSTRHLSAPDRVQYDLNPLATGCCEHLAPIETAMRATGLRMVLEAPGSVSAQCCVDAEALARRFSLPESVIYQEVHTPDRSAEDPPHAFLFCAACQSRLWVLHRGEASPGTPTFPSSEA